MGASHFTNDAGRNRFSARGHVSFRSCSFRGRITLGSWTFRIPWKPCGSSNPCGSRHRSPHTCWIQGRDVLQVHQPHLYRHVVQCQLQPPSSVLPSLVLQIHISKRPSPCTSSCPNAGTHSSSYRAPNSRDRNLPSWNSPWHIVVDHSRN